MQLPEVLHTRRRGNLESYIFSLVVGIVVGAILGTMLEKFVDLLLDPTEVNLLSISVILILASISVTMSKFTIDRASVVEANEFILQVTIDTSSFHALIEGLQTLRTSLPQLQPILGKFENLFEPSAAGTNQSLAILGELRESLQQVNRGTGNLLVTDMIETLRRYESCLENMMESLFTEIKQTKVFEKEAWERKKSRFRRKKLEENQTLDINAKWGFLGRKKWLMRISFEVTNNLAVPCLCYLRVHAGTSVIMQSKAVKSVRTILRSCFADHSTMEELGAWDVLYEESLKSNLEPIANRLDGISNDLEASLEFLEEIEGRV